MEVVIEYVLIENFLINFIVLKTTALFLREKGRFYFFSALIGAVVTLLLPALALSAVGHIFVQIGLACIVACVSFRFRTFKKFLRIILTYFACAFAYGGVVFCVESLVGQSVMILLLGAVFGMYFVLKFLKSKQDKKSAIDRFCYDVEIDCSGKKVATKAFLDSGNLLVDPVTQKPVCLINFKIFTKLFDNICFEDVLRKSEKVKDLALGHYINLSTLNNTDKIFVFQVDRLSVCGKCFDKVIFGLSYKNFDQTFGTDMILHNNFVF